VTGKAAAVTVRVGEGIGVRVGGCIGLEAGLEKVVGGTTMAAGPEPQAARIAGRNIQVNINRKVRVILFRLAKVEIQSWV